MERVFLGWSRPGLETAVEHLVRRFGRPETLDLGNLVVAVPGGRAGRRLLELLLQRAEEDGRLLTPPDIRTIGRLPELLYRAKRPFADDLTQDLAWVAALRQTGPSRLEALVPSPPEEADLPAWLALGEMLRRLHRELAAEALDFRSVVDCGARVPDFPEAQRWQTLADVQERYLRTLDDAGLWDLQTARLVAIREGECSTAKEIVLVGTVDLNRATRLMLDQVAAQVTALAIAPEDLAGRFDEYGCVRPEAWQEATIDLGPEQIEPADAPRDQAAAAVRAIAGFGGRYSGEEITIGVPDERLVPYLKQHLEQAGVPARHGAGTPVRRSGPCRLLEAAAVYLESRSFSAFAALVRHPGIQDWLAETHPQLPGGWLEQLDDYHARHLPHGLDGRRLEAQDECQSLGRVYRAVEDLLAGLEGSRRPLARWGEPLAALLVRVFGTRPLRPAEEADRLLLDASEAIRGVLAGHQDVPAELAPSVSGADALRLVLRQLEGEPVPSPPLHGAIELLGWLELPLDDAPAMIVTGLNDGIVPASVNADLFLPNQLRRTLGIEDNDRRYARDAYALSALAASRKELRLIAGRRGAEGDPLLPSRLLFACDHPTLAHRVKAFFSVAPDSRRRTLAATAAPPLAASRIEIPRPRPIPEVTSMRVTEFRDYLSCPYRYYLRHRLRLEDLSDQDEELDGAAFGSLAHEALSRFGKGPAAASTSAEEVYAHLSSHLDEAVGEQFGENPLPAVQVQVELLRARLRSLAPWQAKRAAAGWTIRYVEAGQDLPSAALSVDGREVRLRGRIDRIDFRPDESLPDKGEWAIFDYKTGDKAQDPERAHRKGGRWIDLQLPLYRHLARALGVTGKPVLGYILLPPDAGEVGEAPAEWSDEDLASADRAAEEVIRKIRQGESQPERAFWPPAEPVPPGFAEFAAICQEGQFAALPGEREEEAAP